jgi:general stress protein YciG
MTETPTKQMRGFALMSKDKRTEIARKGGASVDPSKRAYSKDPKLAAAAGRKGGQASRGGGRKPSE